jgi:hypothetical protein
MVIVIGLYPWYRVFLKTLIFGLGDANVLLEMKAH